MNFSNLGISIGNLMQKNYIMDIAQIKIIAIEINYEIPLITVTTNMPN